MTHTDWSWANIQNCRFSRAKKAFVQVDLEAEAPAPPLRSSTKSRTGPHANVRRKEPAKIVTRGKALST